MRKRWTAALAALALALCLLPAPALAAVDDSSAGGRLNGVEREVYDCLKGEIIRIANGTRTSTEITIPDLSGLSWPVSELGAGDNREDVQVRLREKLAETLDLDRVYDCLTADLPYELFWRDNRYSWGYSLTREGNTAAVKKLSIQFFVSQDYRGDSSTTTNPAKIAAANKAVENAKAIVAKHQDESDYEKLVSYREEICRLVSYNYSVRDNAAYGDPWQLIYVFDGDPATNVVCEGYSKAFKYLCDLSSFDGGVVCRIVTGAMNGGGHMWNVVQMGNGKNYLVDVTNCDSGALGADDKLFLAGGEATRNGQSYSISKDGCYAVYTYTVEEKGLFTDGYLPLSDSDYVYVPGEVAITVGPAETEPRPSAPGAAAPAFQDVDPSEYYAKPVAWAAEEGITNGTSDTTFSPEESCTHGQILTFLWRAAGMPPSDGEAPEGVAEKDYYYDAVRWAFGKGMLEEGFDPAADCSRMDAVWYIWMAFGGPGYMVVTGFTDVPDPVDSPYAWAVGWALTMEVTNGTSDTTFEPDAICDRGQIVTFLYRAYH